MNYTDTASNPATGSVSPRPGDHVLVALADAVTPDGAAHMQAALVERFPGVEFTLVAPATGLAIFGELDRLRRVEADVSRLKGIEARAQAWDHPDATEAERHVARHILGRQPC
jgi:hypothetical protein